MTSGRPAAFTRAAASTTLAAMVRVLHLLAADADDQARRLSSLLAAHAAPAVRVDVVTVGRGGTFRSAAHAAFGLRRAVWGFDLVHAWDADGWSAARLAGAEEIVVSPSTGVPRLTVGARWRFKRRPARVEFVCSTAAQWSAATARGYGHGCHRIEPGAPLADPSRRDELRSRLGFRPDDRVLFAPGPSTRAAGHGAAVWVTSMLHIIDSRYKLLIAGIGPRVHDARVRAAALKRPELLHVGADARDISPAEIAVAADAALLVPEGPVLPLSLVECLAAGLPVVAPHLAELRDVLTERSTAFSDTPAPPAVARRVLELFERPGLRDQRAAGARAEAAERFGVAGFVSAYLDLYRRIADRSPGVGVADLGLAHAPLAAG